jgi:serine/threonine protein kinase
MTAPGASSGRPYLRRWLDRYYLCEPIASGGMATVHAALAVGSAGFHRLVAIKLMHPHLLDQEGFVTMFEDEARISAHLRHPFLASVFDHGLHEGEAFLVMDYLDGLTLHALLRRMRQVPTFPARDRWRWALRLVADACEGLHAAHEACGVDGARLGVVHRDVSPSNLFLCRDGTVRVLDFGVVKAQGRQQLTETGAFKGKLAYMAPEYLQTGKLDRRADIFALGLVLQEMLSLRRAYGTSEENLLLQRVLSAEVLPLREQVKDLPAVLDRAVSQALHPEPEGRYPTARAFGLDLERAIEELGGPFSLGNSAEFAELFLPLEESRREALLRVYPEARASRSDPRRAGVEAPPGHDVAIQTLPAVSSISGEASASGTLRSVGSPASGTLRSSGPSSPPGRALNRLLLGLFVGGGVGGALLALPRTETPRNQASLAGPRASGELVPVVRGASAESSSSVAVPAALSSAPSPGTSPPTSGKWPPPSTASAEAVRGAMREKATPPAVVQTQEAELVRVTVSTPGGEVSVYWQGAMQGSTPCTLRMPPGSHTLELAPAGAPRRQVTVVVRAGEASYVSVPLERLLSAP